MGLQYSSNVLEKEPEEINTTPTTTPSNDTWQKVLSFLRKEHGEATYKSWISKLTLVSINTNCANFTAPTNFIKDWLLTHFEKKIIQAWQKEGSFIKKISIIVDQNNNGTTITPDNDTIATTKLNFPQENSLSNNLDKRFIFENFVVGPPNEFAYTAARAVSESNSAQIGSNPLFLYGGVGLGKTHLMHAIAWQIQKINPNRKVVYLSAEKFMYQFVTALRNNKIMDFKEQYRSVDVLMVDDVQFMCGKDNTQEEFFHTLNSLIDNNRQIVISADRSPSALENMEDRIKSRLGWGLVADIHNTTYELRLGILESKIQHSKMNVPQNVLEFLARKIVSNVRELEGALNKILAHTSITGQQINLDSTREILRDLLRSNEKIITIEDIQRKVAERYNIKFSDMSSNKRLRTIARPRQMAMYLSKILTNRSLAEVGRKFGGKDHTTVIHAVKKIESLIEENKEFAEDINLLIKVVEC
ncbi:MAG: chromosomal replication initiator protein DnaA [Rickettsiales bacterium]|nr:chromosomal replication initiator protein DnaA [Rickettsiales bacterium]